MRLLSLDLERYGPFTDRQLVFPREAKLCVVIGENEAGKSCSLAAITDLLFGIETRTRYDFLHEAPAMRVGAAIEARDGRRLTFKRRKGNKNVLLDEAGQSIGDDALAPFLGGLSRNVFCSAFGLTKEALRAGGEEMTKNDGELGATLFAAASGLRGLTDLRAQFDRDADSIFTPHASKDRRFYQALTRYDDSRRAIRESEVRASDWKGLNDRIEALDGSLRELKDQRAGKASEALPSDRQVLATDFTDTGATGGAPLRWSDGLLTTGAASSDRGTVRICTSQADFAPSCAKDAPVAVEFSAELLLRLLPTTLELERDGYFPAGTPAEQGRVGWNVRIRYRTVLGAEKEIVRAIYAERVRVDRLPNADAWWEKFYRCELSVAPTDGFETTPRPVDVHVSGALGTIAVMAPNGSAETDPDG